MLDLKKTVLAVLSTAAALGGVTAAVMPTASAGTYYSPYKTHIVLNGKDSNDPFHIVVKEYPTAEPTSWLPIWYLFNVLNQLGIQSDWSGQSWNLKLPDSLSADLSNPSTSHASGNIAIEINGTTVQYAPRIAYKDPGGTEATSYVPIWYVMQVMQRLGVKYSWDGTTWGMTTTFAAPQLNKADLAMDFANAVNIPANSNGTNPYDDVSAADWPYVNAVQKFFQADSATHFGATDASTLNMLDHAYQMYVGIPDDHMAWNAGGSLTAWANVFQLNKGLSVGNLMASEESTVKFNLTSLLNGYSKDADGTFHLWFVPYDAYVFSQNPKVTSNFTSQYLAEAIQLTDKTTFKVLDANTTLYVVPGLSAQDAHELVCGSVFNKDGNSTEYSFDGGKTWKSASTGFYGYDSRDPGNGGESNPPSTVQIKATGHTVFGLSYITSWSDFGLTQVSFTPNPTIGVPDMQFGSGWAQIN